MHTVEQSVQILSKYISTTPSLCVVLGSGWNRILEHAQVETEISYKELFGVEASVPGHDGKLVVAGIENKRVLLMAGRLHSYEGYTTEQVTRPMQALAQSGLERIIITAAVGALNEKYAVGDFVILSDMITAFCKSPLVGPKFTDLSSPFDEAMQMDAREVCIENNMRAHEGVYVFVAGPHFETAADKMLYRHLGGDVIGMSTVPETIMANYLRINVLGIACVTNLAFVKHAHEDVLRASSEASGNMVTLLKGVIERD